MTTKQFKESQRLHSAEIALVPRDDSWPTIVPEIGLYPDNTPFVKEPHSKPQTGIGYAAVLRPTTLNSFIAGIGYIRSVEARGIQVDSIVIPYFPGARQDRINPTGDVLFTVDFFASLLSEWSNDQGSNVAIFDPHSPVTVTSLKPAKVFTAADGVRGLTKRYDAIIAPDKGGQERAEEVAAERGLPVVYGSKVRDVETGALNGFDVTVEYGKHYLVLDDICDGGGTFMGLGSLILQQGATADLFVSHGLFTKGTRALRTIYEDVFTTDSTTFDHEGAREFSIVDTMVAWTWAE